ncbi:prepilin-type N-terminal cleavage/methylation domain-containing protein [Vreelandella rituensis]|uniref:Prepilin-type N-terminal cleavage/methylation domain-containing protein n=1 Tax=Vreelandella rituensis TaxID=2282306 RepID=A0A368UDK2_9GAMM|nr:prepilin-type N-terminal cleavage/methylation domain-containing protein [Halomonas rituensis]RCV93873.1 prepilin-type N-terminal cleavage/methylation domain-containing protein [Halomonas rituensis]
MKLKSMFQTPALLSKRAKRDLHKARKARKQQGFTLIELIIVIGVIGAILAIIAPSMTSPQDSTESTQIERIMNNVRGDVGVIAASCGLRTNTVNQMSAAGAPGELEDLIFRGVGVHADFTSCYESSGHRPNYSGLNSTNMLGAYTVAFEDGAEAPLAAGSQVEFVTFADLPETVASRLVARYTDEDLGTVLGYAANGVYNSASSPLIVSGTVGADDWTAKFRL